MAIYVQDLVFSILMKSLHRFYQLKMIGNDGVQRFRIVYLKDKIEVAVVRLSIDTTLGDTFTKNFAE